MKLPELKNKFKNKYAIRIIAGALVVTLVGTGVSVYDVSAAKGNGAAKAAVEETVAEDTEEAEEADDEEALNDMLSSSLKVNEKEIGKEETVYIIADNTGKADSVIVSDHLINNDDKATIEDASTLTDIKNVKGDETFTQNGKKLVWQADGNDVYYQGTGKETTPVTQKLTYFLDGKEITPEELAGKSGKVTIRFDYTNNEKVEATVNGKKEEVCVPFVALSGMVLDDSFSDIEVTNGRVVADGNKSVVFGYALPGLKDSLKVNEKDFDGDISIPDYFEVSADVENFSLDMTMTVAMNATNFVSTERGDEESSLNDLMDELTDATSQLEDGSGALAEGVDTLKDNLGEFQSGMNTLKDGVKKYTDGAAALAAGIGELYQKTPELASGANMLNSSAATLNAGIGTLDSTLKTQFTDEEKAAMAQQAGAAVNSQAEGIKRQAEAAVATQAEGIKQQAEAAVAAQAEGIKQQAEAAVAAQAEGIKQQAEAAVAAQAEGIKQQAEAAVASEFDGGKYDAIKGMASAQFGQQLAGTKDSIIAGIKASPAYPIILNGVKAQLAQQMGTTIDMIDDATAQPYADGAVDQMAEALANGIVPMVQEAGSTAVADAAKQGAVGAAGQAAVGAATQAAGQAAVGAATQAAGQAAVGAAGQAAGQAAVGAAAQAAGQAALEGAKGAAGQAAVQAAEQAKSTIAASINQVTGSGYSLVTGMSALAEGTGSLASSVPALLDGVTKLKDGSQELVANNGALLDGSSKLGDGTNQIVDGVNQLSDGAHELADGIVTFNEEGINKIVNSYNGDIEPLMDRLQAVLDAGADYQSYTDIADGVNGSVKFIYKTAAVK